MTQSDPVIGNKIIAEFMNKQTGIGISLITFNYYHKDWDRLMSVVHRIENCLLEKFQITITKTGCYITELNTPQFDQIITVDADTKLEAVWQAVIEFITWYNNQNKQS